MKSRNATQRGSVEVSPLDPEQNQTPLPLFADPAAGALIGMFLLATCLGGPVGLVLAVLVWMVFKAVRWLLLQRGDKPPDSRDHARDHLGGSP